MRKRGLGTMAWSGLILLLAGLLWIWKPWGPAEQAPASATPLATASLSGPGSGPTRSVAAFPVGHTVSQPGTLEGKIQGRCGNIAWRNLTPRQAAELRRLCPGHPGP